MFVILVKYNLPFPWMLVCLAQYLRKHCLIQRHRVTPFSFFFSFFLALTIGALFHFQLTFWIWCEVGFQINSLACGYPVFWHHLLKKQFFPHWMILAPWLKINELKIHGFLSGLSILLHWSMSVPHKLGHCSSEVSFEIRKCESTTSFFFKIVSSVLNPLHFHMDFGSSLSISIKI